MQKHIILLANYLIQKTGKAFHFEYDEYIHRIYSIV